MQDIGGRQTGLAVEKFNEKLRKAGDLAVAAFGEQPTSHCQPMQTVHRAGMLHQVNEYPGMRRIGQ